MNVRALARGTHSRLGGKQNPSKRQEKKYA